MSGALRVVGTVAGVVALAATGLGALGSASLLASLGTSTAALTSIAQVATVVSVVSSIGAALTAKKPAAQGSSTNITIGAEQPAPYPIGRTYYGGNRVLQVGYGGTVDDVKNPYAAICDVYSCMPIRGFNALQADFTTITFDGGDEANGWFDNFLYRSAQTGALTASPALTGHFGAIPGWGANSKLSGKATVLWSLKFDKKGKKFASGVPQLGAIVDGVYVYDPRQDSTYPGGSGACRILQEATYVGGEAASNPGCNGLTYALGRYQNGVKVFGCGLMPDQIIIEDFVEFANVCTANGWTCNGMIYEPTEEGRWPNLKRILAAGGAEPCFKGGRLGLRLSAPRVPVGEITIDDLADEDPSIPGMQGWRDRLNTMRPKYRSPDHTWEYVTIEGQVQIADWLEIDGEEKADAPQFDMVTNATQACQLGAYRLFDSREKGPIELPCKPHMRFLRPGELITLDDALANELGLEDTPDMLILRRSIDPATMKVTFTLRTENVDKHEYCLALEGTAPPPITLPTSEELDGNADGAAPDAPDEGEWTLSPVAGLPALMVERADGVDLSGLTGIQFEYRTAASFLLREDGGYVLREDGGRVMLEDSAPGEWQGGTVEGQETQRKPITGLAPGQSYEVSVRYQNKGGLGPRLILGPAQAGTLDSASDRASYRIIWQSATGPITSADTTVSIAAFDALLDNGASISFPVGSFTGLTSGTTYALFWHFATSTYSLIVEPAAAQIASSQFVFMGWITTSVAGEFPDYPTPPGGFGGTGPTRTAQV